LVFSANDLHRALRALQPANASGYVVGLSGGADSAALLVAMAALRQHLGSQGLRAIHVHHGLQPASPQFAAHCELLCRRFDVPLTQLEVSIDTHGGRSVEELAREARYSALEANLRDGESLLTAHHVTDQAETFLLQALRGAGPAGLAAMPTVRAFGRGWHLRPLLQSEAADLRAYLIAHGVEHIEDAMNADARFDRSYLRHVLWPMLVQRWPAAASVLSRSAAHVAQTQTWCDAITQADLDACRDGAALSTTRLRHFSHSRQLAVLRAFVDAAQCRAPSQRRLEEALRQMLDARGDRMPAVHWAEHALRRFQNRIYLTPDTIEVPAPREWNWRTEATLAWGAGLGTLSVRPRAGGLDPIKLSGRLLVRARAGGETIKPEPRGATREVRHLFQQRGIVPWMRIAIPYLYAGGTLLTVADLWTDARHRVAPGAPGLALVWNDAPPLD
jgi:tRNA(Ile)-lysidine synthase